MVEHFLFIRTLAPVMAGTQDHDVVDGRSFDMFPKRGVVDLGSSAEASGTGQRVNLT